MTLDEEKLKQLLKRIGIYETIFFGLNGLGHDTEKS